MSYEDDDIEGGGFTGYHVYSGALRKHGVDRESATSMWNGLAPSTKRAFGAHAKSLYEKYEGAAGEHISVASMSKALKDSIMKAINKIKNVTEAELLAAEADAADAALFDDDEDDLDADDDAALAEAAEASIVGGAGKKAAWAHGMDGT